MRWHALFGLFLGLATASKLSTLYVLSIPLITVSILIILKFKDTKFLIGVCLSVLIGLCVYVLTFIMDFVHGGIRLFLQHQLNMFKYMSLRHHPTIFLSINGILTLLVKLSIWFYKGTGHIIIVSSNTYLEYIPINKILIDFEPWLGSFGWFISFILIPKALYESYKRSDNFMLIISSTALGSALIPLIHGNIAWYYLPYAIFAPLIITTYVRSKASIVGILILNIIQMIMLQLHIINTKYTFTLP